MKTLGLLLLLSVPALADNCYVLQRGSDSWQDCKEEARQAERTNDRLQANSRQLSAELDADARQNSADWQLKNAIDNAPKGSRIVIQPKQDN